jgi:hypothetical protein
MFPATSAGKMTRKLLRCLATLRKRGTFASLAFAATTLLMAQSALAQPAGALRLGTNLGEVTDYSPQLPFINLFRSSRTWLTQCEVDVDPGCISENAFDTNEQHLIDLDVDGWVRSLPPRSSSATYTSVATVWDLPTSFPATRYVVLYDGRGVIDYSLGATKDTQASRLGRDVITLDPSRGASVLRITSTDPAGAGNYIRNIRVVAERHEALLATDTFSPDFLQQIEPYQALRFMDWMRTNNSRSSSWEGRAKASDSRYSTERGVPAEIMIELANTTEKAPWFNMPHQANDAYVRAFAELVRARLDGSLPILVEYSNEVWNSGFEQGSWVELQGNAAWPESADSGFTKRINFYGRRSAEICDVWRSVFADDAGRVTCVIASQAANSWTATEALRCPLWEQGPCVDHGVEALAIAPYLGDYLGQAENYREVLPWTGASDGGTGRLFDELNSGGELSSGPSGGAFNQSMQWVRDNKEVADQQGVRLIAYEGGQHLVGVGEASLNDELTELLSRANRETQMGTLYSRYLEGWESEGGGLFMHFTDIGSYGRFGSWGALERVGQVSSPKYDALRSYAGLLPRVPEDTPTPPSSPSTFTISVRRIGAGTITGRPAGILCGLSCSANLPSSSEIRLRAQPARGFRLGRWSGACRHKKRVCKVFVDRDRRVRATFVSRRR